MRRFAALALFSIAVTLAGCDQREPTDPARNLPVRSAVLDGSNGGNPHFFFLPFLVNPPSYSGVFNPNLHPTLEICTDKAQDALGHCTSPLAVFHRGEDGLPFQISIDGQVGSEFYILRWDFTGYAITDNVPFRVVVLLGDFQLGYIDLVKQGNVIRNESTGAIANPNGRAPLPIRFRIEEGAACSPSATECFEQRVGPDGGTFTIDLTDGTKPAGTEFPTGALLDTVNLIIEHVASGECLPTDLPQYQGCYRFRTEPYVPNFELPVTVGVCLLDPAGLPYFNDGQLRLWKWSETAGDPLLELERVQITYLECPTLSPLGAASGSPLLLGAARAGSWLMKPLASLLAPREAYALGTYEGGKLGNFSRIGWVRPLSVEKRAGDNQTGVAGSALPIQPKVRVVNKYGFTLMGVPGRVVDWVASGDGSASPPSNITDANGEAAVTWTLGTTPGANTLQARTPTSRTIAPAPYEAETLFNANGSQGASGVLWLPLIGAPWDGTSGFVSAQITPTIVITENGQPWATLTATLGTTAYTATKRVQDFQHRKIYGISVQVDGETIEYLEVYRGTSSNKLLNKANGAVVADVSVSHDFVMSFRLLQ